MPSYVKAIIATVIAATSFLAGVVTADSEWDDLAKPWVVVGAVAAGAVAFGGVYQIRNGATDDPTVSAPLRRPPLGDGGPIHPTPEPPL